MPIGERHYYVYSLQPKSSGRGNHPLPVSLPPISSLVPLPPSPPSPPLSLSLYTKDNKSVLSAQQQRGGGVGHLWEKSKVDFSLFSG